MSERFNLVELLHNHVQRLQFSDLDPHTVSSLKTFILDSLGVGICGSRVPFSAELIALNQQWGQGEEAQVLATGEWLPAPAAAMVNAWQIHNQEFDCVHEPAVVHPMAVILAALLAFAQRQGNVDGKSFMTAISAAVDVATLLGAASRAPLRFFRPAVCGALGATLAMAKLADMSPEATRNAFGITYSQLSGTMQAHVEGTAMLAMQVAVNARNAIQAIDMARAGLTAPHDVLEGPFGFFKLIEAEADLAAIVAGLNASPQINRVSHKPFPTGRACHSGLDALRTLQQQHGFSADDIASCELLAPPLILRLIGRPATAAMSTSYARLCFAYTAATLMQEGDVSVSCYDPQQLNDPARLALAQRFVVVDDGNPDPNAMTPQTLKLRLTDQREFELFSPATLGSPERPLSREQHLNKFRRCCADAIQPLAKSAIERLITTTESLENLSDIAVLIGLTTPSQISTGAV
ncbi:MmgE/PrpD family protein [Halioxenophilus sp. WMMB6]|uniref:MmgE/PrpD family protein n=1 Tax=Halioxenophilus sp. WMMB6 TaxID=3073815 RepID=UPI00295E6010|nr:MmgE/PrpD family protein [Halioxenophilus sp. WMMB6]